MSRWLALTAWLACVTSVACQPQGVADESPAPVASSPEAAATAPSGEEQASRVITLGGTVTEIVFALGAGDRVVAVDSSSTWPSEAESLPRVGYHRQISAEGILSLGPDLILATDELGPPTVVEQLTRAGVRIVQVPSAPTVAASRVRIEEVGEALGRGAEAAALLARFDSALEEARSPQQGEASALFVYARGASQLMVGGRGTAADELLSLAGISNAVRSFDGFRPLTAEAVVQAAPDVLIMTRGGVESLGGREAALAMPGIAATPAGASGHLVEIDDLLALGFGPRLPEAVTTLREAMP